MRASTSVVVVDDAADVRNLVRLQLRMSGRFDVVGEGGDGLDAIRLAAEHHPDLMLLDVSMPRVDGLEALPRVLEASPRTRVVLYSGFSEEGLAARGLELGATAFIEKSTSIDRLPAELAAALGEVSEGVGAPAEPAADTGSPEASEVLGDHLERFREVFEEAAIGMGTLTLTGQIVRANAALAKLFGRTASELVGTSYPALAGADGERAIRAALTDLGRDERAIANVEHLARTPAGERRVLATLAAVESRQGQPLYVFLQAHDVTEARRTAEDLRLSEERFRLIVEAVQDYAIFMLDREGHISSWNAGAQRIKGYTANEIIGQHFRVFYPPEQQQRRHPEHELELAVRDGRYEEEGWRIRKDGGRFWASVVITAVYDGHGRHVGFAKVTRDITERRRAAEELEAMNERLARAAEEQSQFLAVTAHELRGPVSVLGGSADMLSKHWDELEAEELSDLLAGMRNSADRLRRLLADLLTAARVDAGAIELQRETVVLADVVEAARDVTYRTQTGVDIAVSVPPELVVCADPDRLAQSVENLLGNAVRYGQPPVRITAEERDGRVELRVSDSGPGVATELAARLFERFATGQRQRGTGLGLFIVRELARAQGGDAWYEPPEDGRPHAFVIALPTA
jgi:PAS domain S-box-containing protein